MNMQATINRENTKHYDEKLMNKDRRLEVKSYVTRTRIMFYNEKIVTHFFKK